MKVGEDKLLLTAVKYSLWQVVEHPKPKIKLVEEVLGWDYSSHQKTLVAGHEHKRTQLILTN